MPTALKKKRRGITVDIGFAHLSARDEWALRLGFVDVPGHERFGAHAGGGGWD
jgi:selenocysteine-specific translation elongation factor